MESCDLNVLDMDFRLPLPLRGDRILLFVLLLLLGQLVADVDVFVFVAVFVV